MSDSFQIKINNVKTPSEISKNSKKEDISDKSIFNGTKPQNSDDFVRTTENKKNNPTDYSKESLTSSSINLNEAEEHISKDQKSAINKIENKGISTDNAKIDIRTNGDIVITFSDPNQNSIRINSDGSYEEIETYANTNEDGSLSSKTYIERDEYGNYCNKTAYYDNEGNVIGSSVSVVDKNGREIKSEQFHANGKPDTITERIYDENNEIKTTVYSSYNEDGNLTTKTEINTDKEGNSVAKNTYYNSDGSISGSSISTYDKDGKEIKIEQYHADGTLDKVTENHFDENNTYTGRTEYTQDETGKKIQNKYNADNKLETTIETTKDEKTGNIINKITAYDTDGNILSRTKEVQDENGNIILSKQLQDPNEIVQILYDDISATGILGFASTGENFAEHLKLIDEDNILDVMKIYREKYNKSLDVAIKEENLSNEEKNAVLNRMEELLKDAYDYSDEFEANSEIKNDYYQGDSYNIVQDGETMTITNKSTGKEEVIDLKKFTKELPLEQKIKFEKVLQTLPAEVIIDMYNEDNISYSDNTDRPNYRGGAFNDSLNLGYDSFNEETLVHETGHALDFGGFLNHSSAEGNQALMKAFNEELEAFIAAGNERYEESINLFTRESTEQKGEVSNYATWNIKEMFAETYTLLMLGEDNSQDCILNYFPNTMELVKEHILNIRNNN